MLFVALVLVETTAAPLTAAEAMRVYRKSLGEAAAGARCSPGHAGEITVCGRADETKMRLPLRDERASAGEVVRHPSEPAGTTAAFAGPPREPSRLMDTLVKVFKAARSAATGVDPGY